MCALINIFLIALMVQSGLAIQCYNCDSSTNEKCVNMTDTNLKPEECTLDKLRALESTYRDEKKNWLFKISNIHYHQVKDTLPTPMICQKIIGVDENKRRTTVRRCQLHNINPCDFSQQQVRDLKANIEQCVLCEENGCNGSSSQHVFGMMISTVTAITIFIHLFF